MKSMPDDCSTTLSSVLHQNGSPHDKCAGSGVIIIFQKPREKKFPNIFVLFLFLLLQKSASDCSLKVGQNCQYWTFGV